MPPKRGKRGRPKKVQEVEGEGDVSVVETIAETPVIIKDEPEEIGDVEPENFEAGNESESTETVAKIKIEQNDNVKPLVECVEVPDEPESPSEIELPEAIKTDLSNIDNMESMENDEALDFKGLGDDVGVKNASDEDVDGSDDQIVVNSEIQLDEPGTPIVSYGGDAKYDPSLEETSEEATESDFVESVKEEMLESAPEPKVPTLVEAMETMEQMEVVESTESAEPMESMEPAEVDESNETDLGPETETVSEDELPSETTKPPSDTEAVSDEEFPPTNTSDALLDTEAVSEDELPPLKKKKTENEDEENKRSGDADEESQQKPTLKRSSSAVSDSADGVPSKKSSLEAKSTNKALLELEKYWKAVKEDPADFTGWTYLLQYVDQGQDVEAAREAYDAFLSHYPYCYGYWRKYADYEKKKGDKAKSHDVFERGLAAIPLSVDLWLHYLNHIKNTQKDEEDYIRDQYNRAIGVCGIEFRSDRLWDSYIKWETECKNISNVFALFDKLLTVPTQGYKGHFENFVDFVKTNQPNKMLSVDEFLSIRSEVLQKLKQKGAGETAPAASAPPGDESDEETEKSPNFADEETKHMRDKIITLRTKSFKILSNAVLDRWNYEEGIKRPYFHVKPLERCQLNNWRSYLDYEINQGDKERIIVLFERCLIACALYDEFWVKYVKYLETLTEDDVITKIRDVYHRACTIHHPKKPMLSLNWASFEENNNNIEGARQILLRLEKEVPNSLQISINRINLERRAKNYEEASKLYEHFISSNKNKYTTNALSIKYARFCQKIIDDIDKGADVLRKAIEKDKDNPRLYHQLLDLIFSKTPRGPEQEEECVNIINQFLERESTDVEHKLLFAQHKVEFLEDFGSSMSSVQKAVIDYMSLLKQVKEKRRKQFEEKVKTDEKKTKTEPAAHPTGTPSNGNTSGYQSSYPSGQQPPYQNSSNQYQQQPPSSYGQAPYSQYNNQSDPNYNNYQSWNYQQTPGYNNYNQSWGSYNYY